MRKVGEEKLGIKEAASDIYLDYRGMGIYAFYSFLRFVILRKKGISSKKRKLLLTKLKKYDSIGEWKLTKEGFIRIAQVLGGQKTFERYVDYQKKHKMV